MPYYVLNRNYLLRSVKGHSVGFEKGQPAWVPPCVEPEAIAIGAERADGIKTDVLPPEVEAVPTPTLDERQAVIYAAFDKIVARNDSKEFTGSGVPSVKAIERATPFEVDRNEIIKMWSEYRVMKAEQS